MTEGNFVSLCICSIQGGFFMFLSDAAVCQGIIKLNLVACGISNSSVRKRIE